MATAAARAALESANAGPGDVGAVIVATATPDQGLSVDRGPRAGGAGHAGRIRLRRVGGLQRLRLRALHRRRDDPHRPGPGRAGDRQRGVFPADGLDRSRYLRPVRRRRWRGVPAGRRGRRAGARHPLDPPACRGAARRSALHRWIGGTAGPAGSPAHEWARDLPPMP